MLLGLGLSSFVAADGNGGGLDVADGCRLFELRPEGELTALGFVVGGDDGEAWLREGAKGTTGVSGVEEDDFLNLGTAKDTATPKAKKAKARKTIAIIRGRLDGFSSFLLISKPPKP